MKNFYKTSIWARNVIPVEEWKYRNLKRIMFPIIDVIFILSGFSASHFGVPAISEFYPGWVVSTFALVMVASALVSLLGVSFPKLWSWEIVARSILFGLMVVYFTCLFILTQNNDGNRGFVLGIVALAIAPIAWRLSLLGSEWQDRRVLAKINNKIKEPPHE